MGFGLLELSLCLGLLDLGIKVQTFWLRHGYFYDDADLMGRIKKGKFFL